MKVSKSFPIPKSSTDQVLTVTVDYAEPVISMESLTGGTPIADAPVTTPPVTTPPVTTPPVTTPPVTTPPVQIQAPLINRITKEDWINGGGRATGGKITNANMFGIPGILFEVSKYDPLVADGRRAEVLTAGHQTVAEKWIKKKVSIPSTVKTEPNENINVVLFQYHDDWDEAVKYGLKEFHSPFDVVIVQDKWVAHVRSGTTAEKESIFTLGPILKDKLQTFVCHLKFNKDGVSNGICQIWLDGVLVLDLSGNKAIPMGYKIGTQVTPRQLPYEKQGLYAWAFNDEAQMKYPVNDKYTAFFGAAQEWHQSAMPVGILL